MHTIAPRQHTMAAHDGYAHNTTRQVRVGRDNDQSIMDRGPAVWTMGGLPSPLGDLDEFASLLLVATAYVPWHERG